MAKKPASVVWRVVSTPVATFLATTVALATAAPLGSVTVPSMEPATPTWQSREIAESRNSEIAKTKRVMAGTLFLSDQLLAASFQLSAFGGVFHTPGIRARHCAVTSRVLECETDRRAISARWHVRTHRDRKSAPSGF